MPRIYFYFLILVIFLPIENVNGQVVSEHFEIKSIYFGGGSYYIDQKQKKELIDWLDSFPMLFEYDIVLHGHTDDIGQKEYNQWLSAMRTQSVEHYLIKSEIPEHWIQIKDFGENLPVFDNTTWNGKLNNRRVDVILIPPST